MRRPLFSLILLGTLVLAGSSPGLNNRVSAQSATPESEPGQNVVVLADFSRTAARLRLVDPVRGPIGDWIVGGAGVQPAVIPGPAGVLFASIGAVDGRGTDVLAISTVTGTTQRMAHLSSKAVVRATPVSGDQLLLLTFAGGLPAGTASVPLPERWRGTPANAALSAQLANGTGFISPLRWVGFDSARRLWLVRIGENDKPTWIDLRFGRPSAYRSSVLAPDGHMLYVVDYFHQRISALDVDGKEVVQSVTFGDEQFKRPLCAAALTPGGNRLFVLANKDNSGDGILVFDTHSWRQLDHLLPGSDFTCLIASPDSSRLYAINDDSLTTINVESGTEQHAISLDTKDADAWPLLVVNVSP